MSKVPVFWPRASHCSSSESCIVFRLPEIPAVKRSVYCSPAASFILEEPLLHRRVVRGDPRDRFADDERVDVMRALVGIDALDVGEVAEDGILVDDPVGAERLAGEPGA